jgi:hypothetical protein
MAPIDAPVVVVLVLVLVLVRVDPVLVVVVVVEVAALSLAYSLDDHRKPRSSSMRFLSGFSSTYAPVLLTAATLTPNGRPLVSLGQRSASLATVASSESASA